MRNAIKSLFDVKTDGSVSRVIMPVEYQGSGDNVIIRVRKRDNGYLIDDNGEAAFNVRLAGFEPNNDLMAQYKETFFKTSPVEFDEDGETISAFTGEEKLIAPYVFRVAEAAQAYYSISTARALRENSGFKEALREVIKSIVDEKELKTDFTLPIVGGWTADFYIEKDVPLIIIAATSTQRLLEAQMIYMQYKMEAKGGKVFAIAEKQQAVGKKQFERANYFTDKTVVFDKNNLPELLKAA